MIKNFFLFLIALVLSLVVAEGALRLYPGQFQPGRKYFLNNNKVTPCYANCYSSPPYDGFNVRLNSKKNCVYMRNKYALKLPFLETLMRRTPFCIDYDIARRRGGFFPDRDKEIFIIGDSFAFGEGVLDRGTLAYLLAERLPAYNVLDFAESAADIDTIVRQADAVLAEKAALRIIYFLNLNDPLHSEILCRNKRLIADFENFRPERIAPPGPFWRFWEQLKCVRLIRRTWIISKEKRMTVAYYHRLYFGADNASEIRETFDMISRMNEIVTRAKGRFVLVIYPLIHKDIWGRYPFRDIHDEIKKQCAENHIVCIDGLEAFRKYRSMKPFRVHAVDYHPNSRANTILVDYLVKQEDLEGYLE